MKTSLVTSPAILPVSRAEAKEHLNITHSNDDRLIDRIIGAATAWAEQYLFRKLITQTWKYYLDAWPDEIFLPFGDLQSVTHIKYTDTDELQTTLSTDYYDVDTVSIPGRIRLAYGQSWPSTALYPTNPIEIQFVTGYTYDSTVQDAVFDGVGLNDIEAGGTYSGTSPALFEVEIQTAAAPDTFKWRKNKGAWTTGVAVTGVAQTLSDAVTVTFAATTGHTVGESWEFYAGLTVPEDIRHGILFWVAHLYENRENAVIMPYSTEAIVMPMATQAHFMPHRVWKWVL